MRPIIIVLFNTICILKTIECISLSSTLEKVLKESHPYQITYFTSKLIIENRIESTSIINNFPISRLNLNSLKNKKLSTLQDSTTLKNIMLISLIITFTDNIYDIKRIIDFIIKIAPMYERPKILSIVSDKNSSNSIFILTILRYAWEKNILDITVLTVDENQANYHTMYYFNPFKNYFCKQQQLGVNNVLFPNKLLNVHNYPIKIGRGEENLDGKKLKNQAAEWVRQKIAIYFVLDTMNFSLKHLNTDNNENYAFQNNSFWFHKLNANLLGGLITPMEFTNISVVVAIEMKCRTVLAAAPIIYVEKVFVPVTIFFYTIFFPGTIFTFIFLIQYIKGTTSFFKIFDAVQLILGQSPDFVPRVMVQKIVYMNIVILFVYITNELYSDIVEINFGKEEVPFENLEDLGKFPMPIYVPHDDFIQLFSFGINDPLQESIGSKVKSIPGAIPNDCIDELVHKDHVCIYFEYDIKGFMNTNTNPDGSNFLKSMKYQCDPLFVQFEMGSPYIKRFMKINRRVREGGFLRMEYLLHGFVRKIENIEINEAKDKNLSTQQLYFILSLGYFSATIAFLKEYFDKNYNTFRKPSGSMRLII